MHFNDSKKGPFSLDSNHKPSCACCVGKPDDSFERACLALLNLRSFEASDLMKVEEFVRMCRRSDLMELSKSAAKKAQKMFSSGNSGNGFREDGCEGRVDLGDRSAEFISVEDIERMNKCVLDVYADSLKREREQR